jgi:hypothetical protein
VHVQQPPLTVSAALSNASPAALSIPFLDLHETPPIPLYAMAISTNANARVVTFRSRMTLQKQMNVRLFKKNFLLASSKSANAAV